MKVIGLTGGIGSGKSTIARFLGELGAVIIDADKVGHEALKPGTEIWREVVASFGRQIVTNDGTIDRKKLGDIVFRDPDSLSRLNHIMHPRMYDMVKARLEEYRRQGVALAVVEAPLFLEAGWTPLVDEVWVVVAPEPAVLEQLKVRAELTESQVRARIRSQMRDEEWVKQAHVVINNNGSLDELRAKVEKLWPRLAT